MTHLVELHGHRGARGLFPENTLAGFAATLAIGVDAIEIDVALTADDVVVVSHDPVLNPDLTRERDGAFLSARGPAIRTLRAAELAEYDVGRLRPGSAYAALYPEQVPVDGAGIPTLADVLRMIPMKVAIELKTFPDQPGLAADPQTLADAALSVAREVGAIDRVMVQSFDWRGLRHVRDSWPGVPISWLTRSELFAVARLWWDGPDPADFNGSVPRAIAAEGGPIWGPLHGELTAEALAEAHSLGLRVIPWTVNAPDDIRRLLRWGVDGLISDRPDLARVAMAAEGLRLPPPRPR